MLAIEDFIVGDDLAGVSCHASHRSDQACFGATLHFVVRLVVADRVDQVIPFDLVGVAFRLWVSPQHVLLVFALALVDTALGWRVTAGRDGTEALAAVSVAGELVLATCHRTTIEEHVAAVSKRVFDGVVVEVLVDHVATEVTATGGLCLDGPSVLHPAAFVDVVDVEVAVQTARSPHEAVEALDLVHQFADAVRLLWREGRADRAVHTISTQRDDVTDFAVLDTVEQFATSIAVTAHQTDGDLEVFLDGLFAQGQHLASARTVDGDGLFHERVDSLFNRIGELHPAESRRGCEDHHVARAETVHGLLVTFEANELAVVWNVDGVWELALEALVAGLQTVIKHVSHSDELDGAALGGESIGSSTGTTTTATDECDLDRVVFRSVNGWDAYAGQSGSSNERAGRLDEVATRRGVVKSRLRHGVISLVGKIGRLRNPSVEAGLRHAHDDTEGLDQAVEFTKSADAMPSLGAIFGARESLNDSFR